MIFEVRICCQVRPGYVRLVQFMPVLDTLGQVRTS
jgi:hypothetical protein